MKWAIAGKEMERWFPSHIPECAVLNSGLAETAMVVLWGGRQTGIQGFGAIRQCRHSVDRVNCGIAFATLDLSSFAFLQSVDICGIG